MEGKKAEVCRFFLKGQCKNGEKCTYEHPQVKEKAKEQTQPRKVQEERVEIEIKDP